MQVPSDDPAAVKPWLADHQSDPAVQAALEACAGPDNTGAGKKAGGTEPGPTADALVACLERHVSTYRATPSRRGAHSSRG